MATDTVVHDDIHHDEPEASWEGGDKKPFKASYGKLMMWYFLLSDAFTFAGFLIAYGAIRFSMPAWPVPDFVFSTLPFGLHEYWPGDAGAPLIFVTFMTFVLIISSVTMVRGVQEGQRNNKRGVIFWMALTIIGGATFLGCQAWEWSTLIFEEGVTVTKDPFSAHADSGTYMSGAELVAAGFVAKDASKAPEIQHGDSHGHGHSAEGDHKPVMYYLKPGTEDIEANRFWVKRDHHKEYHAGESFKVQDPYLITKGHDTHLYENAAYKSETGEIRREELGPIAFGSLFFFITGFHGFHVFSGVIFLIIIMINVASGLYDKRNNKYEMVEKIGLYWHFVDLVWVFVFLVFYLL